MVTPLGQRSWIENQIANLYKINADSAYIDPSNRAKFFFNAEAPSLLGGEGDDVIRGYFVSNTGNRIVDAIATVAVNELGIDNAYKAFLNVREGNYGAALKEAGFAFGELLTVATPVLRGAVRGATALPRAVRVTRPAKARYSWQTGTSQVTDRGGLVTRAGQTLRGVPSQVRADLAKYGSLGPTVTAARGVRGAVRTALPKGARLRRLFPLAGVAGLASIAMGRDPAAAAPASIAEDSGQEALRAALARESTVEFPAQSAMNEAANKARLDVEGIQRQYDNILRELQGSYRLSETEQERERLRFMLSDIEAQRDAGLQAISEGYTATVAAIRERATLAAEGGQERAGRFGAQLDAERDMSAERMALQNLQQQQEFRGLGSGSADPSNEWIGLMSALAPAQSTYTQRMGDITSEGINWLADTTAAQGLAQQGDLQRLAAATRSGAILSHQDRVAQRTQREAEMQRAAMQQILSEQARAMNSAQEFNARLVPDRQDMMSQILGLGLNYGLSPEGAQSYFGQQFDEDQLAMSRWAQEQYTNRGLIEQALAGQRERIPGDG
jgi:hypothetical protein